MIINMLSVSTVSYLQSINEIDKRIVSQLAVKYSYNCLIVALGLQLLVKDHKPVYDPDSKEIKDLKRNLNKMEIAISDAKSNSVKNFMDSLSQ